MKTSFIFCYFTLRTSEIRITILFFEVGNGVLHVQECNNLLINSHPLLTMPWGPVAGTVWGLEMLYSSIIFLAAGLILILRNQIINSCFKIKIRKSKSKSIQENECTRKNPRCMSKTNMEPCCWFPSWRRTGWLTWRRCFWWWLWWFWYLSILPILAFLNHHSYHGAYFHIFGVLCFLSKNSW